MKAALWMLASVVLVGAPVVSSADRTTALTATKLDAPPRGIKVKGTQVREVWTWTAADGTPGYLVLSATSTPKTVSRQLYGQLFAGKQPRELRLITDGISNCKLDLVANFVAGSVAVEDVDRDGVVEVSFAYDVACSATADPVPRKLMILEGPAKYALRGRSMGKDPDDKVTGGGYTADSFKGAEAIGTWAKTRWQALLKTEPTPFE